MTFSSPTDLLAPFSQSSDALDCLILSDAFEYGLGEHSKFDGDVLLLEDTNLALTAAMLAKLKEQKSQGRVFFRARSYALTQQALSLKNRLSQDLQEKFLIADEKSLDIENFLTLGRFSGQLALGRLPKSHAALDDWAQDFASYQTQHGAPATLLFGGNTKHMSKNFNQTLAKNFAQVQGLRGKGKHRCLLAQNPLEIMRPKHTATGQLVGLGGVFSGAQADAGGRLLADCATKLLAEKTGTLSILDFGCGNGSVSRQLLDGQASSTSIDQIIATDIDADAIRSAQINLGSDSRVQILWDDAAEQIPNCAVDLVLLNPPFHDGTRIDLTMVQPLLVNAWRVLKPGGELLLVHNSHARYRPEMERIFGTVQQVTRNSTFTVLKAQKSYKI